MTTELAPLTRHCSPIPATTQRPTSQQRTDGATNRPRASKRYRTLIFTIALAVGVIAGVLAGAAGNTDGQTSAAREAVAARAALSTGGAAQSPDSAQHARDRFLTAAGTWNAAGGESAAVDLYLSTGNGKDDAMDEIDRLEYDEKAADALGVIAAGGSALAVILIGFGLAWIADRRRH